MAKPVTDSYVVGSDARVNYVNSLSFGSSWGCCCQRVFFRGVDAFPRGNKNNAGKRRGQKAERGLFFFSSFLEAEQLADLS